MKTTRRSLFGMIGAAAIAPAIPLRELLKWSQPTPRVGRIKPCRGAIIWDTDGNIGWFYDGSRWLRWLPEV